jgi:HSP20 family protein
MQTQNNQTSREPLARTQRGAEPVQERPIISPPVDVYETKDEVVLVADVPGVTQEGLRIDVVDDRLTLKAPRTLARKGSLMARELAEADFQRTFILPDGIDRGAIDAKLSQGVLTLRLPKAASVKPRRIEVKSG